MSDLRQISLRHQSLLLGLGTFCASKAGLAEGTNANTFKIAAPNGAGIDFCIDGVAYHKADTDNIAFATAGAAFTAQPDLSTAYYLVVVDSDGTVTVLQGVDSLTAVTKANAAVGRPGDIPFCPASRCPIGAIKVVNSGGTFTPGSTDLGAGTVTDSYYDFMGIPSLGAGSL